MHTTGISQRGQDGALAELLLERGGDPNDAEAGYSALYAAVLREQEALVGDEQQLNLELVRVVHGMGVDVNTADARGNTPLHDAVRNGFLPVVEFLARHGADPRARNDRDQTALTLAETALPVPGTNGRRATRPEIAALLRSYGDGQ